MFSANFGFTEGELGVEADFAQPVSVVDGGAPLALFYEPEARIVESWFAEFLQIIVIAQEWKKSLPLVEWANSQHLEATSRISAEEIREVVDELNAMSFSLVHFLAEWTDSLNPLAGLVTSLKLQIDYRNQVFPYVNGQGARSSVFAQAEEISLNLSPKSEKLTQDIEQIYILMLSALKHAPPFTTNLVNLAVDKMADNLRNYPPEVFTVFDETELDLRDETKKELSPVEKNLKYTHVLKCLKWLRSLYSDRLLPKDWELVKPFILAFRSSEQSLSMLQTEWLRIHPELLRVEQPVLVYAAGGQSAHSPVLIN